MYVKPNAKQKHHFEVILKVVLFIHNGLCIKQQVAVKMPAVSAFQGIQLFVPLL